MSEERLGTNAVECRHLKADGTCEIASSLARRDVIPHVTACRFCTDKAEPPQELNRVTVSIAIGNVRGTPLQHELMTLYGFWLPPRNVRSASSSDRLKAILAGDGPGSQLWRLLEQLGIEHTANCPCLTRAEQMNTWGVIGCREHHDEIVTWMKKDQGKYKWNVKITAVIKAVTTGVAWRLSALDPFGSLVDEAIRRAEVAIIVSKASFQ